MIDFHTRRLGLLSLGDAIQSLLGGEVPVIDDETKRAPRQHPKPALPYRLCKSDLARMAAANTTLHKNPELIFTVLGERPEWTLEAIKNTAIEGDLGFEHDCVWHRFDGPAVLFGYSHGIKARWLIDGERIVRWLCGSPARECWRQSLLRPDHQRVYIAEGEPDTLTCVSLGLEEDDEAPSLVVGRACAHGHPDPAPFKDKEVVIIADPDKAGIESAKKAFTPAWANRGEGDCHDPRMIIGDRLKVSKGDLSDAVRRNREAVREQIKQAAEAEPPEEMIQGKNGNNVDQFFKAHRERKRENLLAELQGEFGEPLYRTQKGKPTKVNERFWAEYLARERILICERDEQQFYVYSAENGCYDSVTIHALKAHLSDILGEANNWGCCQGIKRLDTEGTRHNVVQLTRGITEKRDFFVNRPAAVHCQNTMILLKAGNIYPVAFSPEFRSRNQLSVAYQPAAQCVRLLTELLGPALGEEDLILIQKMFGLMILGLNRPQRIFMLDGDAGTGKTTTGRLIIELIGRWNYSELRPEHMVGRFEMGRAFGKTLLFGPDVDAHFMQSAGAYRLKSAVGGDPMDAERKNSNEHYPFVGDFNVLVTSNCRLLIKLQGDLDAWLRRLAIIHFGGTGPKKRIDQFQKVLLKEEGSGILNWALAGLTAYETDHQTRGDIILSRQQQERVSKLLTESDGFRRFLESELILCDEGDLTGDEIIAAFADYARQRGWKSFPLALARTQLQNLMLELYSLAQSHSITREAGRDEKGNPKYKSLRGYRGVKLRKNDDLDPEL